MELLYLAFSDILSHIDGCIGKGLAAMTNSYPARIAKVGPRNLASIAIDQIRADIVRGVLKPGEKLRIQSLSEKYAMNASAIREALSRLVTDGLVEAVDQRGFRVTRISRQDLLDLTQARIDLECLLLTRSIELGDVEWESKIVSALHQLSRCAPPSASPAANPSQDWGLLHQRFHEALISGGHSTWLFNFSRLLYEQSERYRNVAEHLTNEQSRDALKEHRDLTEAVLQRNAPLACAHLKEHFTLTTQIILKAHEALDDHF
jgi:GntR family transcriptional regulator, carbon starvation induced regulator